MDGIKSALVKPRISIVGRSDTGKSTLINALLGVEKMPVAWTPTTSIAVYIKHINDRPNFIKDDTWVFANRIGNESFWNPDRLYDEEYCKRWKIAEGEPDILRTFGTRQGGGLSTEAGSAVIFVDSPILNNCDIIDLPGFGTDTESDDKITRESNQYTDILIYLSQANGFMRVEDINYLKENMRTLPVFEKKGQNDLLPLSNLFVIASQAHTVNSGNERELSQILKSGYQNFSKGISESYWDSRKAESGYNDSDYGERYMSHRFYTYTTDIPALCKRFEDSLKLTIEKIPEIRNNTAKAFIREYIKENKPYLKAEMERYEEITDERNKYNEYLNEIEKNETIRIINNNDAQKKIIDRIDKLSSKSISDFTRAFNKIITVDNIENELKKQKISNKKDDILLFSSKLNDSIISKCESILRKNLKTLAKEIESYLQEYDKAIQPDFDDNFIQGEFNTAYAFASACAKIGVFGGLIVSLASEAVFAFGSLGLIMGAGGTAALIGSTLGPIGLAAGILIGVGLGIVSLFTGGWRKKIAKNLVKQYEDNNILDSYISQIKDFWEKNKDAFNQAATGLEEEWQNKVQNIRQMVNIDDINEIEAKIAELKTLEYFFDNIPL